MRFSLWTFIVDQWRRQPPVLKADLTGKTVLVLGANTGLGFEAAKHFATMTPGRLILACRSQSKGQAAVEKLKADTGYSKAELWIIDLASFESVKQFANKFERDGGRLDILVENAAISSWKYEATEDGWDISLQVNHLSTSLLALLLLPVMIKTAQQNSTTPRIVLVSSGMHYLVEIEKGLYESQDMLRTLGGPEYRYKQYVFTVTLKSAFITACSTTLQAHGPISDHETQVPTHIFHIPHQLNTRIVFNVFFVRALNAHLPPSTPLVVDAVCPGYCYSELRRELSGLTALFFYNSRQLVCGALAYPEEPEKLRGEYVFRYKITEVSDFVLSAEGSKVQKRSWCELLEILGNIDSRVTANIKKYLS
ncbi:hypothetical protein DFH06DRAFT_1393669 [Mycena polygramma]|nr:hypothetical protein DFH06DRAFT_1393669 [Mycena polygramma]